MRRHDVSAGLAALSFVGCASPSFAPVARYPWVEHQGLALRAETLVLRVGAAGEVDVDAVFHFEGEGLARDRDFFFPIPPPRGPAEEFRAWLEPDEALEVWPGGAALPVGDTVESFRVFVPGEAFARHRGVVRVHYKQRGAGAFAYTLKSGAYWRGPIGSLAVRVSDPEGKLARASVEGAPPHTRDEGWLSWSFRDVEPRSGVWLELR